jgi:hypothetical protein
MESPMYSLPNMHDATDRLAHFLSEVHNDGAPIGWERYRFLANSLMRKFPIRDIVMDERFDDHTFQPGKTEADRQRSDPWQRELVARPPITET